MQDFEASDDVATTNIDTAITATRMSRSALDHQIQTLLRLIITTEECRLCPFLKDNIGVLLNRNFPALKRRHWGASHAFQIFVPNLPADSIHSERGYGDWGVFFYLNWSIGHGSR
jgi:hypothetical protein